MNLALRSAGAQPVPTAPPPVTPDELLRLLPVGIVTFGRGGNIEHANPLALSMLAPLAAGTSPSNVFALLARSCPDLEARVAAFAPASGTILDHHQFGLESGRQSVVLTLTVTRVAGDLHMAVFRDITRLSETLSYVFACADLLVDVNGEGRIAWAGGAFQALLGMSAEAAIGRPMTDLFDAADRDTLSRALLDLTGKARMRPQVARLANRHRSACVVSGLALEGPERRFLMTIGPLPVQKPEVAPLPLSASAFAQKAQAALLEGKASRIGLFDLPEWNEATASLDVGSLDRLRRRIGGLAGADGETLTVSETASGRFSVLAQSDTDLGQVGTLLGGLVSTATGRKVQVESRQVDIVPDADGVTQGMQALRLVLNQYAKSGASGCMGLGGGLAGVLQAAQAHRRSLSSLIAERRFELAFQPVVAIADGRLHHYEALIRPRHDKLNPTASPGEFVALSEALGLAPELDRAVLARAIEALPQLAVPVAVNLSALSLADPRVVELLRALSERVTEGTLLIEMTETAEIPDIAAMARTIEELRMRGMPVCLDDFGAGHASFRVIRDLTFDFVKIDGTFVRAACDGTQGRAFIRTMCDLARSTGAVTIAEMVETESDAAVLQELGVELGQGWHFGRPMPLEAAKALPKRR